MTMINVALLAMMRAVHRDLAGIRALYENPLMVARDATMVPNLVHNTHDWVRAFERAEFACRLVLDRIDGDDLPQDQRGFGVKR